MRILVYEFVTGGGTWAIPSLDPQDNSLLAEGAAMIRALCADLQKLDDVEVLALRDSRLAQFELPGCTARDVRSEEEETKLMLELCASADWTVLIAPEFDQLLLKRCVAVEQAGGKLLGPSSHFVALASDKHRTCETLSAAGVPVPRGVLLKDMKSLPENFTYPAVLKPRDGAGSLEVRRIADRHVDVSASLERSEWRLETFCEGLAASVAVLCGPAGPVVLAACRQHLSNDGQFRYLGGELPLSPSLARRAQDLALAAINALPPAIGYVGVDMVLGEGTAGRKDVVIEINPRLTTSYVGLRAASKGNLAQAMLDVAAGRRVDLLFHEESIEFTADGRITNRFKRDSEEI